jgi:predicted nuclease with TOPRIM domain
MNDPVAPTVHEINIYEDRVKQSHIAIRQRKEELKKHNQMYKDIYEQDAEYDQLQQKENEIKREKARVKDRLVQQSSAIDLKQKIEAIRSELKDGQMTLSDYLEEYSRTSNATTIEIDNEVLSIVKTVKLAKRK